MHLLIRAVSLAGQPLTQAISAYFDERGGTIGRSDTNTLALPDPERRISRLQAEVSRSPDGWRLLNVGNANPIWHNNKAIAPGEGALLDENDELQIGTYALQVTYSKNDATARTITKGRAAVDSRTVIVGSGQEPRTDSSLMQAAERSAIQTPSMAVPVSAPAPAPAPVAPPVAQPAATAASAATPASPFADLLGGFGGGSSSPAFAQPAAPSSGSPFADLLGTPAPMSPPASSLPSSPFGSPAPAFAASAFGASAPSAPAAPVATSNRLPDDFDPFADFQAAPSPSGRPASSSASSGSWDLPKSPTPPASANPFDLNPGAPALPGDLDLMGSVAPAGANSIDQLFGLGGGTSSDPLASFLKKTEPAAPAEAAAGMPSNLDPLALITPRADVEVAPSERDAVSAGATLPDDVPELQAAMVLPPVAEPAPAHREPLSASFSFMPPPSAAASKTAEPAPASLPAQAAAEDAASPSAPLAAGASPFADLGLGEPARASLLDDLDLSPQTVPSVHVPRAARQSEAAPVPADDLLGLDLSLPVGHEPLQAPLETQLPIPQTAVPHVAVHQPEPVKEDEAPTNVPLASPVAPAAAADTQALWNAFCEGAGIRFNPPQGLNPDLMRVIGQLLHHTVDGSLKLVAARAATKQEMRAEVTVIQARRNNPLKFSPDTQSAMEQLLQPPMRGFMTGPEAVADAMDDLLGHTIGTMVGMRAALEGVLARFEPEQLETKLVGRSMLDSLLPMNRRAKLWELYLQHYESVKTEAQDDFHNLFGRAFLQAYEEQLDRLDAERRQSGRHPAAPTSPSA
ncbi:MAG: type VI secretion system-associated FHA domain protein TagH [Aquabacterium sp.]|uniref:type VI secretion system-associated FHA domain protein TagH n=1 Tax=Aquabacterium sp. TaxID=1872578 RepID=UPI0025B968CC|nr:type VI secretion system-associated FHA domain protein TagH [Aquabacterium sp.]MBI5924532.1 type VI secretion system-associated FHA domain protein TagH [Aquabacterium sp.]